MLVWMNLQQYRPIPSDLILFITWSISEFVWCVLAKPKCYWKDVIAGIIPITITMNTLKCLYTISITQRRGKLYTDLDSQHCRCGEDFLKHISTSKITTIRWPTDLMIQHSSSFSFLSPLEHRPWGCSDNFIFTELALLALFLPEQRTGMITKPEDKKNLMCVTHDFTDQWYLQFFLNCHVHVYFL